MFDATTLAIYLAAAVAVILSPGPDTAYVLARGAGEGPGAGVRSALGVATGVLVHTVAAAVGLAALFRAVPAARTVVVLGGAVYLSYLGVGRLRRSAAEARDLDGSPYLQGLTINVLNPQVALFFLAFLPGFAPESAPAVGMVVLGALYALVTAVYLGGVGALSGRFGGGSRRARVGSGIALLGIAAWLVATNVPA